jgi:hypothetical protein
VLKNQTETVWGSHESLLDNLKPYKDNAAIFGTVSGSYSLSLSSGSGLSCSDFFKFHDSDDDLNFDITADRQNLDAQPRFWTNGWINSAVNVQGKLNAWQNSVHCEIIMFGHQHTECSPGDTVFLPGWAESGANSALANGTPINAGVTTLNGSVVIQGEPLQMRPGSRVRVIGPLVLDCGHGISSPCYESENDPNNLDSKNLEIHPVYSVDVLQDFVLPRPANIDLTGSWAASDVGTYYLRQIGNPLVARIEHGSGPNFRQSIPGCDSGRRGRGPPCFTRSRCGPNKGCDAVGGRSPTGLVPRPQRPMGIATAGQHARQRRSHSRWHVLQELERHHRAL